MRRAAANPVLWDDELVALLADTQENKRARQVFEFDACNKAKEISKTIVTRNNGRDLRSLRILGWCSAALRYYSRP